MIWIIVIVGVIVLGIVAVAIGRGRKGAAVPSGGASAHNFKMPKAGLRDIREITGKHEYPITIPSFSIGRAATNQVVIDKPTISSKHATIEFRDNTFYLVDQRSTNGTSLNGQKVTADIKLKHGDRICFDQYEFVFVVEEFVDEEKTRLRSGIDLTVKSSSHETGPGNTSPDEEPPTRLKDMCPNHPSWKATEVCSICHVAYCEKCIKEKDGRKVCVKCDTIFEYEGNTRA